MSQINLVLVSFENRSKAFEALNQLKHAADQGCVGVRSAAVIQRDENGQITVPAGADNVSGLGALGGGLVGSLIGILGGPVGVLLGWGTGALIGGLSDAERIERGDATLLGLSQALAPGSAALAAEVEEPAVEIVDGLMSELEGIVLAAAGLRGALRDGGGGGGVRSCAERG